jgi:hypothetical protein
VTCDSPQDAISNAGALSPMVRRVHQPASDDKAYPVLVRVRTSVVKDAGTSAAVFISLYGTTGTALKQVSVQDSKFLLEHC